MAQPQLFRGPVLVYLIVGICIYLEMIIVIWPICVMDFLLRQAIPSTTTFARAENVGGRVRGPSPLAFQWLDFCLQPARAATFQNDVFVGASPLHFTETAEPENHKVSVTSDISTSEEIAKLKESDDSRMSMKTNIVQGMPPPDIIAKSEFLEPLSEKALADYQWLMSTPLDVQGWPNDLIEFAKGSFQGLLQWANRQGTRS